MTSSISLAVNPFSSRVFLSWLIVTLLSANPPSKVSRPYVRPNATSPALILRPRAIACSAICVALIALTPAEPALTNGATDNPYKAAFPIAPNRSSKVALGSYIFPTADSKVASGLAASSAIPETKAPASLATGESALLLYCSASFCTHFKVS